MDMNFIPIRMKNQIKERVKGKLQQQRQQLRRVEVGEFLNWQTNFGILEKKKKKLNESDQVKEAVKEVIKEEDVNGNGVVAVKQKEQKEKEQNEEKLPAVIQQQQQVAVKPQPQQQEQQQVQPEYTAAEQQLRMGDRFLSRELLSREK